MFIPLTLSLSLGRPCYQPRDGEEAGFRGHQHLPKVPQLVGARAELPRASEPEAPLWLQSLLLNRHQCHHQASSLPRPPGPASVSDPSNGSVGCGPRPNGRGTGSDWGEVPPACTLALAFVFTAVLIAAPGHIIDARCFAAVPLQTPHRSCEFRQVLSVR